MVITFPIAFLFEIFFPILLAAWFIRRYKLGWRLVFYGGLGFLGSQLVHLPLLSLLTTLFSNGTLPAPPYQYHAIFNAVLLGLLAGLCEEPARLVVYTLLKKRARSWNAGVALGIGHGGTESIFFVGIPVLITFATMVILRLNPQAFNLPANIQAQVASYWTTSWDLPLAGAVERLSTMVFQIALSVIVLQAVLRRSALIFIAAILWHALVDAGAVFLTDMGWTTWSIEVALLGIAILNLWVIRTFRTPPELPSGPEAASQALV